MVLVKMALNMLKKSVEENWLLVAVVLVFLDLKFILVHVFHNKTTRVWCLDGHCRLCRVPKKLMS